MYKWLLFDADGTILDFDSASVRALELTFAFAGIPHNEETIAAYKRVNHDCWVEFERGELSAEKLRAERFHRLNEIFVTTHDAHALSNRYIQHLGEGAQFLQGAVEMLDAVQGHFNLFLITNGLAEVQHPRFASAEMSRYFTGIVISDEVHVAKPHPRIFDICFEQMGNPAKSDVLMIGDGLTSDMRGGIDYGIDTCWVNLKGKTAPIDMPMTYEITDLSQLAPLLGVA